MSSPHQEAAGKHSDDQEQTVHQANEGPKAANDVPNPVSIQNNENNQWITPAIIQEQLTRQLTGVGEHLRTASNQLDGSVPIVIVDSSIPLDKQPDQLGPKCHNQDHHVPLNGSTSDRPEKTKTDEYKDNRHYAIFGQFPTDGAAWVTMEMEAQENTQLIVGASSKGGNSVLTLQDETEILCILHPSSPLAHEGVEIIRQTSPQHLHMNTQMDPDSSTVPTASFPNTSTDIALRMTSEVRDRRMGFVFGRNPSKCDVLIARNSMEMSSAHFRIFVNLNGVLMLEDMSMNGTFVDAHLLRSMKANPRRPGSPSTRMLSQGSIVELPVLSQRGDQWIRFIVSFPARNNGGDGYQLNLQNYIEWIRQDERRAQIARAHGGVAAHSQPMPYAPLQNAGRDTSPPQFSIAAATGQNQYGMRWNGGEKYNVVGYIGQGAVAMVYKLSTVEHGVVYACKQIEKRRFIKDGQNGLKMHHEIRIMERISHPNIVQFVDFHETTRDMFIVMEFVPLGDLTVYTNSKTMMHEHMCQHVAAQICKALEYLHKQSIAHRDIKPDNILVAKHSPYLFKLSDFGLSKVVSNQDSMITFCGTILYCAPEIYPYYERVRAGMPIGKQGKHIKHPREETRPYYYSVDTWGIAGVLFHLLSGHPAWPGNTDENGAAMLEAIFSTPIDWDRLNLAGVSDLGIDFLKRMMQIDPAARATDEEVLSHPWIKRIVSEEPTGFDDSQGQDDKDDLDGSVVTLKTCGENNSDAAQLVIKHKNHPLGLDSTYDEDELVEDDDNRLDSRPAQQDMLPPSPQSVQNPYHPTQTLPLFTPRNDGQARYQANNRLFGEIPQSALQSSGVLGQNAKEALDLGNSQIGDVESLEDLQSSDGKSPEPEPNPPQRESPDRMSDFGTAKLYGAEDLVEDFQMVSYRSDDSDESPPPVSKRSNQHLEPVFLQESFKRSRNSSYRLPDHNPEEHADSSVPDLRESITSEHSYKKPKRTIGPSSFELLEVPQKVSLQSKPLPRGIPKALKRGPNLNTFVDPHVNLFPYDQETTITLGTLTPTKGSIPTVPCITITNRTTTFGRDPTKNTFVHPGDASTENWERVGKNCIDLTMWYANIEKEIQDKTLPTNWYENPKLTCLISTRTSRYILVNGTPLEKGHTAWMYGELRTGDLVTVVEPDLSREPQNESETKSLSFRCHFFTGASQTPRADDGSEPFRVHMEAAEFAKNERVIKGLGRPKAIQLRGRKNPAAAAGDKDVEAGGKVKEKDEEGMATFRAGLEAKREAAAAAQK